MGNCCRRNNETKVDCIQLTDIENKYLKPYKSLSNRYYLKECKHKHPLGIFECHECKQIICNTCAFQYSKGLDDSIIIFVCKNCLIRLSNII